MATKLRKRTVVVCGGGFTAGLIARQLTAKNVDVLVLERGGDRSLAAEARLASQRDELHWACGQGSRRIGRFKPTQCGTRAPNMRCRRAGLRRSRPGNPQPRAQRSGCHGRHRWKGSHTESVNVRGRRPRIRNRRRHRCGHRTRKRAASVRRALHDEG